MKRTINLLLSFMLFVSTSIITFANDDLLYHYDFNNRQMYSFEGEMARLYYPEINLEYPGTYYISSYHGDKLISVKKDQHMLIFFILNPHILLQYSPNFSVYLV